MATAITDRDGKSKTASAVDAEHYPEQNEVPAEHPLVSDGPDIERIKARAHNSDGGISDKLQESSGSVQR